jgi:cysteine-rich repeat protein
MSRVAAGMIGCLIWAVSASSAGAATLTVTPDKATYDVGDTITLAVTGDPQQAQDVGIFGRLIYSSALTRTESSSQQLQTTDGTPWLTGTPSLAIGDGFADVFNQIEPTCCDPVGADNLLHAQAVLTALAPGEVDISWNSSPSSLGLEYFGLTNASFPAAVARFTIVDSTCGNGVVESGEQCDDGAANGTSSSCCAANCTLQPAGQACDDGNPCTGPDTCSGSAATCSCGPLILISEPTNEANALACAESLEAEPMNLITALECTL